MANASYAARQPPAVEGEEPVHVLVTGFGPFLDKYPKNSSWEIASTLPALLPSSSTNASPIKISVHHAPVRVNYSNVLALVPTLLPPANSASPAPDIVLHIGLAASRTFYAIEDGAHARGYGAIADVDGEMFGDEIGAEAFPESRFPGVLTTGFDTRDVLGRWKLHLQSSPSSSSSSTISGPASLREAPDLRTNPDAGNFLCGFIYYNSLARYFEVGGETGERPVVFLHVPDLSSSQAALDEGRDVAIALIKALVESRKEVGVKNCGANEGKGLQEDDSKNNTVV
ncbi:pyroglutamyl peptidase type [Stagonosporopsis vannaccii]|nr:pyroglutamyl peptidase type [Stagonosporopsis vannaccii]